MLDLTQTLATANDIVSNARAKLLTIARSDLQIEKKADKSFVTRADKETELFIRGRLQVEFPDHAILGEEFPGIDKDSRYTWVIDPIDGTHSFRHGIPLSGTMLCLMDGETPIVSVIDLFGIERCYSAAKGLGAFRDGTRIGIHDIAANAPIEDEVIATGERKQFVSCGQEELFDRLMTAHDHVRTYCDCFGHALAAEGAVGAMVDFNIRIWDCMASVLLVEEAGGKAICLGTRDDGGTARYDWVFGKPHVVDWVVRTIRR